MLWQIIMVGTAFLMHSPQQMRTWAALFFAGSTYLFIPPDWVFGFMLADFAAGVVIITRPAGQWQRAIGALFCCMVMFHVGYMVAAMTQHNPNGALYSKANQIVGWVQLFLLASWGLWDVGKPIRDWLRSRRGALAHNKAVTG